MSDFEDWFATQSLEVHTGRSIALAAYLAGQSSAEQRVKELTEQLNYTQGRLESWRRDAMTLNEQLNELKAQAGEKKYICDQIPHPETVPCKFCQPLTTPSTPAAERPDYRAVMIEAIEFAEHHCGDKCNAEYNPCWARQVADALRTAIAALEAVELDTTDDPVLMMNSVGNTEAVFKDQPQTSGFNIPLFKHPASAVTEHCQCPACKDGVIHASDCAVHNEPAYPNGECNCHLSPVGYVGYGDTIAWYGKKPTPETDLYTHPTTERRAIPEDVLSWIDGVLPVVEIFGTTPSQKQWSRDRVKEARAMLNAEPAKGEV